MTHTTRITLVRVSGNGDGLMKQLDSLLEASNAEDRQMSKITKIIIHAADTPASMDIGAAEIRRWHVDDNGWRA